MRLKARSVERTTEPANLLGYGDTDMAKSLCFEVLPNTCLARSARADDRNEHCDVVSYRCALLCSKSSLVSCLNKFNTVHVHGTVQGG